MIAITPLYAGFFGLLLILLSWRITSLRSKYEIKMGDGGHTELTAATRAHGNLIEYLPTALLLMIIVEMQGFSPWVLHTLGLQLVTARVLHLRGVNDPSGKSKNRKIGTRLTWIQIALSSLLCIAGKFGITF